MAEQTYMIRSEEENVWSTTETILQAQPFIAQSAAIAIMNNYESNCVLRIKDIQLNELIGRTGTTRTSLDFYKITGHTEGIPVTPIKFDSTSNIPSQIVAYKYPGSVTTTGSIIRKSLTAYHNSMSGALQALPSCDGSMRAGGLNGSHFYRAMDTRVDPIILREGEGFAIKTGLVMHANYPVELTITFTNGTNSFMISEIITISSHAEFFSIMNGSGSGVVLRVARVAIKSINESNSVASIRQYTLESCVDVYDGTSITPTKFDSNSNDPDSLLDFKKNCIVLQGNQSALKGRNARWGGDITPWRRNTLASYGTGVQLGNDLNTIMPKTFSIFNPRKNKSTISQIVLREGEGICLISKNWCYAGRYEIIILFTIDDAGDPVGGGGEHSYVF